MILVLSVATAASVLVPRLLTSHLNAAAPLPATTGSAPVMTPSPSSSPVVVVAPTPANPATGPSPGAAKPAPPPGATAFRPIVVEAEDPANTPPPGAGVAACIQCSGGYRIRYIAGMVGLVVPITVPTAGNRSVTIVYETDSPRDLVVCVNGVIAFQRSVLGTSWEVPESVTFPAWIPAGRVTLAMSMGPEAGPDIDKVIVA